MVSLFAKNILEVLAVLFLNRQEAVYQSKIAELTGLRRIQIQRALQRLLDENLVEEHRQGNMVYFKLRESHPLMSDLKNILYKTVLLAEPFKKALESVKKQIHLAFIYGSFASGTETLESDIDVFIVGEIGLKQVSKLLSSLAKQLQREINPVVYSQTEFLKKLKSKDHFVTSVIGTQKMWLVGDENELRKMD